MLGDTQTLAVVHHPTCPQKTVHQSVEVLEKGSETPRTPRNRYACHLHRRRQAAFEALLGISRPNRTLRQRLRPRGDCTSTNLNINASSICLSFSFPLTSLTTCINSIDYTTAHSTTSAMPPPFRASIMALSSSKARKQRQPHICASRDFSGSTIIFMNSCTNNDSYHVLRLQANQRKICI